MGKGWLAVVIIITIAYAIFVTQNAFVTKRQVTISMIDVVYLMTVSMWSVGEGSIHGFEITVAAYTVIIIWCAVLCHALSRNKKLHEENFT